MAVLTLNDAQKSVQLNLPNPMLADAQPAQVLLTQLDATNTVVALSSLSLTAGPPTYTVNTKDSRSYQVVINVANPPTFQLTSASYWSQTERIYLESLGAAINSLVLVNGMTSMTVTYN